jgi:hypothetical protein
MSAFPRPYCLAMGDTLRLTDGGITTTYYAHGSCWIRSTEDIALLLADGTLKLVPAIEVNPPPPPAPRTKEYRATFSVDFLARDDEDAKDLARLMELELDEEGGERYTLDLQRVEPV